MEFIADLHIHSHYSRATSKTLTPEHLDYHAGLKGIKVVGTGDFTHPGWLAELKKKTEPAGNGLFRLKRSCRLDAPLGDNETRFLLTAEISNIYKRAGKVRKVHNVILVPGFEAAEKINQRLENLGGNLVSDGRPILGLDARDLLEIVLESGEDNYFIPAHIWTPWFSMLGSKSGFDSPEACFGDLTPHIHTIETGLSTDPPMNWLCSFLDRVTLVSNSDAHSPDRLGRNANVFNTGPDYFDLTGALRSGDPEKFSGTIDLFPQEGKYHYDGHRKCNVCWAPSETLRHQSICPVCNKPVTEGVMNRIIHLSDREDLSERPNKLPFRSIIPLRELLAEIHGVGVKSKRVEANYLQTLQKLGKELDILLKVPLEEIESKTSKILAEAVRRMRNREVIIREGYDGEYGTVKVFYPGEQKFFEATHSLFRMEKSTPPPRREWINFDLKGIQKRLQQQNEMTSQAAEKAAAYQAKFSKKTTYQGLNPDQLAAVQYDEGPSLIMAGPGTGKTKTLTAKIAWLVGQQILRPGEILAITFTNKAAAELRERLLLLLKNTEKVSEMTVATFHAFGLSVLKHHFAVFNRTEHFFLADDYLRSAILRRHFLLQQGEAAEKALEIREIKKRVKPVTPFFESYEKAMERLNAFDLDDLIVKPLRLFQENEKIRRDYRRKFRAVFVDEYQDTNDVQYQLLRQLVPEENPNLCVVGDANQSIYGFRGANVGFIRPFTEDYPGAEVFRLKRSYRCSQTILSASADVLKQPSGVLEGLSQGVKLSVSEQPTGAAEAEFIARKIVELVGGVSFFSIDSAVTRGEKNETIESLSDLAVLCRTRGQFEAIGKALRDHHVPYQETGTLPFFREKPFQGLIDLLGAFSLDRFEKAVPLLKLKKMEMSGFQFRQYLEVYSHSGLIAFLNALKKGFFPDEKFGEERWNRFTGLAGGMKNLREFTDFLRLGSGSDVHRKNLEAVSLMTLHASKGLEFGAVFIPGCEDGLLPYSLYKTDNEADREEEKRLLYVGMTRARKMLFLTRARTRFLRGRKFSFPESPFLKAIRRELVEQVKPSAVFKRKQEDDQLRLF